MHSTEYTVTRDDQDIDLEIEYSVAPYDPGNSYGPPECCDPPSGGEIEEMTVTRDGAPFDVTDAEREKIEAHIYETHDYDDRGDPDDY